MLNNNTLINTNTHKTIIKTINKLNYQPNTNTQTLTTQINNTINIIIINISNTFFNALIKTINLITQQHQKYILINNNYHKTKKKHHTIKILIHQHYNTLIIHSKTLNNNKLTQFINNIPNIILINHIIPKYTHHYIYLNNLNNTQITTHILLNNNHQHINYLSSNHNIKNNTIHKTN